MIELTVATMAPMQKKMTMLFASNMTAIIALIKRRNANLWRSRVRYCETAMMFTFCTFWLQCERCRHQWNQRAKSGIEQDQRKLPRQHLVRIQFLNTMTVRPGRLVVPWILFPWSNSITLFKRRTGNYNNSLSKQSLLNDCETWLSSPWQQENLF